jgi:hypothetical protein
VLFFRLTGAPYKFQRGTSIQKSSLQADEFNEISRLETGILLELAFIVTKHCLDCPVNLLKSSRQLFKIKKYVFCLKMNFQRNPVLIYPE